VVQARLHSVEGESRNDIEDDVDGSPVTACCPWATPEPSWC